MERIRPEDIIAKYSPEEICEGAEAYYASLADDPIHMQKPLRTVFEAADCFEGLGMLLRNLKLAAGMRVLDFGAGTCWISNCLCQMGCVPTACDPSKTALDIGRKAISRNPWIEEDTTEYLIFDGRKIDAPDNHFDRIICYDVLHHLPNWEEILREMYRVLKEGGMIGFREPGYDHSQKPSSQYEMRHFTVLENDIRIDLISKVAKEIGFEFEGWEPVSKRSFSLKEYACQFAGFLGFWRRQRVKRKLNDDMRKYLRSSSCFYLSKGQFILDSRVGSELEARIEAEQSEIDIPKGGEPEIGIKVSNTGKALWLGDSPNEIGKVLLGVHLLDREGKPLRLDLARIPIGGDLKPGESRVLSLRVPGLEAGDYLLDFDMVSERVNWFEMGQSSLSEKARVRLRVKEM